MSHDYIFIYISDGLDCEVIASGVAWFFRSDGDPLDWPTGQSLWIWIDVSRPGGELRRKSWDLKWMIAWCWDLSMYLSSVYIYTLHITWYIYIYLYFNSWQCLTLTVMLKLLSHMNCLTIVKMFEVRSRCQHAIFSNITCAKLRQLIHLSAAFSRPLLWPSDGVLLIFFFACIFLASDYLLMLWNSFQICVEKDLVVWSSSETFRNSKTRKERQRHPKKHMLRLAPRFALRYFVGSASARFAIAVMSHFRHSWCIENSCLLGRFSLDASKGTWRMMWRQDSSSPCFWNLSVWMSKHAQVAQLVGYVSENAAYHHGEMSLVLPSSICVLNGSPGWILKAKKMLQLIIDKCFHLPC